MNDESWLVPHRRRDGTIVEGDFGFDDDVLVNILAMVSMPSSIRRCPMVWSSALFRTCGCSTCHQAWPDSVRSNVSVVRTPCTMSTGISCRSIARWRSTRACRGGEGTPGLGVYDVVSLPRTRLATTRTRCIAGCGACQKSTAPTHRQGIPECASQRDQIWRPEDSRDTIPCTDSTANVTSDPEML